MGVDAQSDRDGFYRRLEVPPRASHADIARAYRRLAHGVHPDAHPDDPDASRRFQEITEAYETLGDPKLRAVYDNAATRRQVRSTQRRTPGVRSPGGQTFGWGQVSQPDVTGPPVVIGRGPRSPASAASTPLWAGPVRVEPRPAACGLGKAPPPAEAGRLLAGLFGPWWWD
jgi:curved DNA-binding protein CbpA